MTRGSLAQVALGLLLLLPGGVVASSPAAAGGFVAAPSCQRTTWWTPGEVTIYWFDVEQGDAQLVVGPTGRTLLVDLGKNDIGDVAPPKPPHLVDMSPRVAARIRQICGQPSTGAVNLDDVLVTHDHRDHEGDALASEPSGVYALLVRQGFTATTLIARGAARSCADGLVDWTRVGQVSTNARAFQCWLLDPDRAAERRHLANPPLRLVSRTSLPVLDLGSGARVDIVQANGWGVTWDMRRADGTIVRRPLASDWTGAAHPPNENDYSVGFRLTFGRFRYASTGDAFGRNVPYGVAGRHGHANVEHRLATLVGNVDVLKLDHHGTDEATSAAYLDALTPAVAVGSCGPRNRDDAPGAYALRRLESRHVRVFLTNRGCHPGLPSTLTAPVVAAASGATNRADGQYSDVVLRTDGTRFRVSDPAGSTGWLTASGGS